MEQTVWIAFNYRFTHAVKAHTQGELFSIIKERMKQAMLINNAIWFMTKYNDLQRGRVEKVYELYLDKNDRLKVEEIEQNEYLERKFEEYINELEGVRVWRERDKDLKELSKSENWQPNTLCYHQR